MSSRNQAKQENNNASGSPQSGEPVYLAIGKLRRSHGVKGEIILEMTYEFPKRIKPGLKVFIGKDKQEFILSSIRPTNKLYLVSIEGFNDCDAVSVFRNQWVYVYRSTMGPLPDGLFYQHEVIGMQVIDAKGNAVGIVKEILETGANDVYVVNTPEGEEILLPAVKSVILSMSRETNSMVVQLQQWD